MSLMYTYYIFFHGGFLATLVASHFKNERKLDFVRSTLFFLVKMYTMRMQFIKGGNDKKKGSSHILYSPGHPLSLAVLSWKPRTCTIWLRHVSFTCTVTKRTVIFLPFHYLKTTCVTYLFLGSLQKQIVFFSYFDNLFIFCIFSFVSVRPESRFVEKILKVFFCSFLKKG